MSSCRVGKVGRVVKSEADCVVGRIVSLVPSGLCGYSAYLGQVIGRSVGRGVIRVARIGRVRVGVAVCGISDGRSCVCTVSDRGRVSRVQQQPSLVPSRFRRYGLGLCRFDGLYLGGFRLRESRGHQDEKSDNLKIVRKIYKDTFISCIISF